MVGYVKKLQRVSKPSEYFELHVTLLTRLREQQAALRSLERLKKGTSLGIAALKDGQNFQAIRRSQAALDRFEQQRRSIVALRAVFLQINDGLAWRALDFDRAALCRLGEAQQVTWLTDKIGFEAEVAALREYWDRGFIGLHNDGTTCLRVGDITGITPTERVIHEIKRSGPPGSAQLRRIEDATSFLNNGEEVDSRGRRRQLLQVPTAYETHLDVLGELIREAQRTGYAVDSVGDVFSVAAIHHRHQGAPPPVDLVEQLAVGMKRSLSFSTLDRRLRDRRGKTGVAAPFAIYPFPAEDVADLLLGYLDFVTVVDVDAFETSLGTGRYTVSVDPARPIQHRFLTATQRSIGPEVSIELPAFRGEQILGEMMTMRSLKGLLDASFDCLARQKPGVVDHIPRQDERAAWLWTTGISWT